MSNQTIPKYSEQITQAAKAFTLFGVPSKIIMDGEDITPIILKNFNNIEAWLCRLAVAFSNLHIKSFIIRRINGIVSLTVKSIY